MIPPTILKKLELYARQTAPKEACAILIKAAQGWEIKELANLAGNPQSSFAVDAGLMDGLCKGREAVFFHSHPFGPSYPSLLDMQGFVDTKIDWLIADISVQPVQFFTLSGKGQADLHNRPFRHGISDCYSLIRDYYKQIFELELLEYPRGWQWWSEGFAHYRDQFKGAGFFQLEEGAALQHGDIALIRLRAKVANHAAIWCGDGLLFHHLASSQGFDAYRFPQYDPAERFAPFIEGWIRHHSLTQKEA